MLVRAKAPLRVSFAGGGTDVSPFPEAEGGVVLSATIDRYAYGSLRTRADGTISIESVDFGLSLDFPPADGPAGAGAGADRAGGPGADGAGRAGADPAAEAGADRAGADRAGGAAGPGAAGKGAAGPGAAGPGAAVKGVAGEGAAERMAFDGRLDLVKAAIRRLSMDDTGGYDLLLRSTAPPGSGLGSSSTTMVALVGLLREYYALPLSEYEIAHLAWEIERRDLGIAGGLQDHYAATFGGFNFIEFGDRVIVNPLRVRDSTVNELELNLLLCYTGITRESAHIIGDQTARVQTHQAGTLEGLRAQKELAVAMKAALLRGELDDFGELLGQAWLEKKKLSPLITTDLIDEAYDLAVQTGATGGKVTGAGGGGYILFYCDFTRKHRVAQALEKLGVSVTEFSFERRGLTTWRAG
ncbi:MAG TPA: GHMP kinase [Mycobacteriales bacterium]|nr:GHMP kinase [Mycobacteriales bacterium]